MVQWRDGCPVNPRWPDRRSSCDNWASGSSFSSNKQSQLLRHPLKNLQNKGGNLPSYSLCLFRLEIGNSVSQCYSSSPHDHDSGVQSLQQKKKRSKREKVKLGNCTRKGLEFWGVQRWIISWRLRHDTKPPCWEPVLVCFFSPLPFHFQAL